mmetsp:Transcript_7488/g.7020  ORF Transcript_7488/g.7020 Transcript_7488/m.7020 type:complete len:493 (-) Transcript_7488:12-1490(-)
MTNAMIEQIQLLILTALIGNLYSLDMMWLLRDMSFLLLNFNFFRLDQLGSDSLKKDFPINVPGLEFFDFHYSSTILNIANNLLFFGLMFLVNLVLFHLYIRGVRKAREFSKFRRMCHMLRSLLGPSIWFRLISLSMVLYLITSLSELGEGKQPGREWTYDIAQAVCILCAVYTVAFLGFYLKIVISGSSRLPGALNEMYRGIGTNPVKAIYPFMFLVKKFVLCSTAMAHDQKHGAGRVGVFLATEVVFLIYLAFARPFKTIPDNIVFCLNSLFMAVLTTILIFQDSSDDWPDTVSGLFLAILFLNGGLLALIPLLTVLQSCCKAQYTTLFKTSRVRKFNRNDILRNATQDMSGANFKKNEQSERVNADYPTQLMGNRLHLARTEKSSQDLDKTVEKLHTNLFSRPSTKMVTEKEELKGDSVVEGRQKISPDDLDELKKGFKLHTGNHMVEPFSVYKQRKRVKDASSKDKEEYRAEIEQSEEADEKSFDMKEI